MSHYSLGGLVAWVFHGTARGEIQWLTARCIAAPCSGERSRDPALNDEFEGIAVSPDEAGIEMSANDQRRRIGKAGEQFAPRHHRLSGVGIGGRRPVEMRHLAGMVGDI